MFGYGRWFLRNRIRVPGLVGAWPWRGIPARGLSWLWLLWLRLRRRLVTNLANVLKVRPEGGDGFLSFVVSHPQDAGQEGNRKGGAAPKHRQERQTARLTMEDPSGPPSS